MLNLLALTTMNKPNNDATTDRRYQELSLELERTNEQLHALRLKARRLNEEFLAMKAAKPQPPPPKPTVSSSIPKPTSKPKPKSKPLAQDNDLMLGGVSD